MASLYKGRVGRLPFSCEEDTLDLVETLVLHTARNRYKRACGQPPAILTPQNTRARDYERVPPQFSGMRRKTNNT